MASCDESVGVEREPLGRLIPRNIVSTFYARIMHSQADSDINLPAAALVTCGKYNRGVFPAVVSKSRIPIAMAGDSSSSAAVPPEWSTYPLISRFRSSMGNKKKSSKHRKQQLQDDDDPDIDAKLVTNSNFVKATVSMFSTGKNVVAGGISIFANLLTAYTVCRRLSDSLCLDIRVCNFETQNIVCSAVLGFELNPDWIASEAELRGWEVYYNPEEFIGLSWMTDNPKIVYVVFSTGKIVATGIKSMEMIAIAEQRMIQLIAPFKKGAEPASFNAKAKARMRDPELLATIKKNVREHDNDSKQAGGSSKDNAARRNIKRLNNEVRKMIKTMDIKAVESGDYETLHQVSASAWSSSTA